MTEYDYDGDMSYFQDQLTREGITKEQFNMDQCAGLTASELQSVVKQVIANKEKIRKAEEKEALENDILEWFKRNYPEKYRVIEERKKKHYSRFDFMTPEEYQFWVEEHS